MMNNEEALENIQEDQSIEGVYREFIIGTPKVYECSEHGVQVISVVHDPQAESDKYCPNCYQRLFGSNIE